MGGNHSGTIGVIGAGISGLRCAGRLAERGYRVTVVDKGRGVAGRMATRRTDGGWRFDHGAQYFTARGEPFSAAVRQWQDAGVVAEYRGRVVAIEPGGATAPAGGGPRYVGMPGMNAVCKVMAGGLDVRCGKRVERIVREAAGWRLEAEGGEALRSFDAVVLALPAPQVIALLGDGDPIGHAADRAEMRSTLTMMVGFEEPIVLGFDMAFINGGPIALAVRQGSKPGREDPDGREAWTVHANHDWSEANLERGPDENAAELLAGFGESMGMRLPASAVLQCHRWRYAAVARAVEQPCLWDDHRRIGACGDWLLGNRIECAFDSGDAMAEVIMDAMSTG